MKNYYSISFVSMSIGWIGLIITHIGWSVLNYKNASAGDTGVIIFWSGLFSLLFYLLFIVFPQNFIRKQLEERSLIEFSIGSAFYSLFGFTILIGWGFLLTDFYGVFIDAFVAGLTFGITFWLIWNKNGSYFDSIGSRTIGYLIPCIFLIIYLKLFPLIFPSFAYNYVPRSIKNKIEIKTLSNIKIGDSIEDIKSKLPGFLRYDDCRGSRAGQYEKYDFRLQWNCCKIVDVEVGKRGMVEMTIGGRIVNEPCDK